MAALGPYVDFAATGAKGATAAAAAAPGSAMNATAPSAPAAGKGGLADLRKGLTLREVEALLGPATTASEEKQGPVTLLKRNYAAGGMKVAASFVNDVLVDFTISPQ
jgi:hypothetical protein